MKETMYIWREMFHKIIIKPNNIKENEEIQNPKKYRILTSLAVNTSFPSLANKPSPSADALRCDAQMSPSARILCHDYLRLRSEKKKKKNTP